MSEAIRRLRTILRFAVKSLKAAYAAALIKNRQTAHAAAVGIESWSFATPSVFYAYSPVFNTADRDLQSTVFSGFYYFVFQSIALAVAFGGVPYLHMYARHVSDFAFAVTADSAADTVG